MKRFSEQLNKKSKTVKLRAAEKRELRERVVSYMEYHPLPNEMKAKKVEKERSLLTEEYKEVALPLKMMLRWAVGTAAILIISMPFVAERSVPGDSLYAVKRFNEEVRGTLAFDTIQKVEWETERLNRRISEARLLASEGRLTDEVEEEVAEAVRTHTENAQKNIEVLRGEDADEATLASIALETTLTVQSAALHDELDENGEVSEENNKPSILATAVEETRVKTTATNASSTIPAFDKIMAKVEVNTTRVYELRDSLVENASEEEVAEITRRIEDINRSVEEAITLREENDEQARAILIDSLQRTQKLIVFMTDIDVSQMIDIETIIPVVLTEEEQAILAEYKIKFEGNIELESKIEEINTAMLITEDEAVIEKVNVILSEIDSMIESSSSTDFVTVETTIMSALDLVNNIYVLLELNQEEEIEIEEETGSTTEQVASSTDEIIEEEEEPTESENPESEELIEGVEVSVPAPVTDISSESVDTE